MPNLHITPLERELFLVDPTEFITNLNDMTSEQKSRSPKVKTIKLLECICDHVDKFIIFIVDFYINVLYLTLSKNDKNITLNYKIPEMFEVYLNKFTDEELIEQVLQVFSSLSYTIYDRKIVNQRYEDDMDTVNHILVKISSEFLKAKLCNFYSMNLDDMFHDKRTTTKSFDDALDFMFLCLVSENKNVSLNLMALDGLNSLIFDEDVKDLVSHIIGKHLTAVLSISNAEIRTNPLFNAFLKNLLLYHYNDFGSNIVIVFNYFWEKIVQELKKVLTRDENACAKKNSNLLEYINSVKSILVKSESNPYKEVMYNEVLKLSVHLESFLNYAYEEDILSLLILVYNDVKLIHEEYKGCLHNVLDRFIPEDSSFDFERYHITFIFAFVKNIREDLVYKDKVWICFNDIDI
jgi:hypothetical protein